jgi:hypothetical protein
MLSANDVVHLAARVLEEHGHPVARHETWIEHLGTKYIFEPHLIETHALKDGGIRSVTTIKTNHSVFAPDGIFEYQHATGDNLSEAICRGFSEWIRLDLTVLVDALRDRAENCTAFEMSFPQRDDRPPLHRRALLGPVAHYVQGPSGNAAREASPTSNEEAHPFCPCCLLTNSFDVFRPLIEANRFFGIRLVAIRDESGSPLADCRVNGEDFEDGARALCGYVERWPKSGYEIRRQYVVLQSLAKSQSAG